MSSTMLSQFRRQRRMRRFKVGLIRVLGNPIRWNQRVESLQLFSHLCAVEHYHVEGEATPCANEIFEVAISDFPVFQSTDHIQWLYPIIYKSTTSLKVPENSLHDFSSRSCSLESFGAANSFPLYKEYSFADECRPETGCLPSGILSLHAVSSPLTYSCYSPPWLRA
jgi:hypothetical protein